MIDRRELDALEREYTRLYREFLTDAGDPFADDTQSRERRLDAIEAEVGNEIAARWGRAVDAALAKELAEAAEAARRA